MYEFVKFFNSESRPTYDAKKLGLLCSNRVSQLNINRPTRQCNIKYMNTEYDRKYYFQCVFIDNHVFTFDSF